MSQPTGETFHLPQSGHSCVDKLEIFPALPRIIPWTKLLGTHIKNDLGTVNSAYVRSVLSWYDVAVPLVISTLQSE